MHKFNYFMYYSLLRILGKKYKKLVKQIRIKYYIVGKIGVQYKVKNVERIILYYHDGFCRDKFSKTNNGHGLKPSINIHLADTTRYINLIRVSVNFAKR